MARTKPTHSACLTSQAGTKPGRGENRQTMPRLNLSIYTVLPMLIVALVGLPVAAAILTGIAAGDGATWDHIFQNRLVPYTLTTILSSSSTYSVMGSKWSAPIRRMSDSFAKSRRWKKSAECLLTIRDCFVVMFASCHIAADLSAGIRFVM